MYQIKNRKRLGSLASALMFAVAIPGVASAVPISLSGNLDTVFSLSGAPSPFSVGDPVSGGFDLDFGADNTFDVGNAITDSAGSVSDFSVTVGPATFNVDPADITQLSGRLSDDGTTLDNLFLDTSYLDVGLGQNYKLQIQNSPDILYVDGGPLIHAPITATVNTNATAVPEPGSLALFGLGALLIGISAYRLRSKKPDFD